MAPEQGGALPRKDACSLVNASMIDSWMPSLYHREVFGRICCIGYLSRRSGLIPCEERCEQPCLKRHDCLSANGLHLPSRDVEHGEREGALPSV
jgi:hypothetical protein